MASLGSNKELEASSSGKSQRTSLIFNLDGKEDFSLCSLTNDKVEQQPLDLVLTEGETIAFRVEGPHSIHLSGYYINDDEDDGDEDGFINDEDEDEIYSDEAEEDSQIEYDSEMDSDEDSEEESDSEEEMTKNPRIRVIESDEEDMDSDEEMDSEDDEDIDSEDDSEEEEEEESEEEVEQAKSSKKVKFDLPVANKVKETPKEQVKATTTTAAPVKVTPPPAKATPVVAPATPVAAPKPASPQNKEQGPVPVKKTLPSGLQIEDLKLGNGAKVSNGKKVLIHYKGTLTNGQVFDSSFGGKPLKFSVGKGEVIKGMDIGIVGMAIGGSRKLVIPGPLAYGNQALPKIPRNSTLIFEIRLEKIL